MEQREGYVPVPGGRVWYEVVGSGPAVPLLLLHGGPRAGHDYLEALGALAADRPVIFYDQFGCGKSPGPDDRALRRIDRFVAEVGAVRRGLGPDQVHLFGHSWGGWLAIEYMVTASGGVLSLVLASTSASLAEYARNVAPLVAALPEETREILRRYEALGEYHHPEYEAAVMQFLRRHFCRLDPWPDALMRSRTQCRGEPRYETMQGPNELTVTGNLKDRDRHDPLHEIAVPTLITCGRYDEVTPRCALTLQSGIAGSRLEVFQQSAHMAHLEEPEKYARVIRELLSSVEQERAA